MSDEIIVGIDLGTTFSAISYINSYGKPEIISNIEGDRTTPSVIYFENDGTWIVGKEAKNLALTNPGRTVRFIKREMGNSSYRFNVDGKDYFPEDLQAMILTKLKHDAEKFLGTEVKKAVISVPAYFKDSQREATKDAGKIADLEVVRIINEPTAAALTYGLDNIENNQTLLIYDFGGGTFDVTIMKVVEKEFQIIATAGDSMLGGKDIDGCLVEYLAGKFIDKYDIDLRKEPSTHQDLWDKAEQLKKDLSFRDNLSIILSSGDKTLRVDLNRETFESLISVFIKRTEECMKQLIDDADMNWSDIDTVVLSGGTSRIPAVRNMIKNVTGKDSMQDMNPDECVSNGAAIQGEVMLSEIFIDQTHETKNPRIDVSIKDVTSHSLGIKAISEESNCPVNSIIIPRFTPIPCERKRIYKTSKNNLSKIEIEILQGESTDPDSPETQLIGKTKFGNLPNHEAGELVIEISLKYNADGVVEVTAKETKSGAFIQDIVMEKTESLLEDIIEEKIISINQSASQE